MDEVVTVGAFQEQLLNLSKPLAALDLPLLDAHGATLASDLLVDEKPVIRNGQLIDSTQIACLLYTSPSPRDGLLSRMPSSA